MYLPKRFSSSREAKYPAERGEGDSNNCFFKHSTAGEERKVHCRATRRSESGYVRGCLRRNRKTARKITAGYRPSRSANNRCVISFDFSRPYVIVTYNVELALMRHRPCSVRLHPRGLNRASRRPKGRGRCANHAPYTCTNCTSRRLEDDSARRVAPRERAGGATYVTDASSSSSSHSR